MKLVGAPSNDVSRQAGRGGLAVAGAKAYFILAGLVQQMALPRVFGLDGYGALATVLSAASIAYNPIVTTSIQGVSRAVAGAPPETADIVFRRVLVIHVALAVASAVLFFVLAGPIGHIVGAPHAVPGLRVLSLALFLYGSYAPLIGALNGQKRFVAQASFDVLAATLRTFGLIVGAVLLTRSGGTLAGVEGASWGFVASTVIVFAIALFVVGSGRSGASSTTNQSHLAFIGRLFLAQVVLNLLLQADLMLLRRFGADAAQAAGLPLTAADGWVGAYRATQLFSFLPYQLLVAVAFVLFPMLASARRDGDRESVARYVQNGVRIALLLAGAMVSVTSGLSGPLLRLIFGTVAEERGTLALEILSLGFGAFALLGVLSAVLTSLGRERATASLMVVALVSVVALSFLTVRGAPLANELLTRTAIATSTGITIATIGAAWLVRREAGALVAPRSALSVALALAIAITCGRLLPLSKTILVVPAAVAVVLVYAVTLIATREIGRADLEIVKRVVRPKG